MQEQIRSMTASLNLFLLSANQNNTNYGPRAREQCHDIKLCTQRADLKFRAARFRVNSVLFKRGEEETSRQTVCNFRQVLLSQHIQAESFLKKSLKIFFWLFPSKNFEKNISKNIEKKYKKKY